MGDYPRLPGNSCQGRLLTSLHPRDSKPNPLQPISKRAASNWQAKRSPTKAAGTQTDLGEAGRGVRSSVTRALGQAVVMVTASWFTSGQQNQFSAGGKPEEGDLPPGCCAFPSNRNLQKRHGHFQRVASSRSSQAGCVGLREGGCGSGLREAGQPQKEGGRWSLNQQRGLWKGWKAFRAERIHSCVSFLGKTWTEVDQRVL